MLALFRSDQDLVLVVILGIGQDCVQIGEQVTYIAARGDQRTPSPGAGHTAGLRQLYFVVFDQLVHSDSFYHALAIGQNRVDPVYTCIIPSKRDAPKRS